MCVRFSFNLGIYLGGRMLAHMEIICLTSKTKLSFQSMSIFFIPTNNIGEFHLFPSISFHIEHLFIYLPAIPIMFFEISVQIICPFLIGLFASLLLSYGCSVCILHTRLLSNMVFANISPLSVTCIFIFLTPFLKNRSF